MSRELNYKNSIESENTNLLKKLNKEIEELKILRKKETKILKKIEEKNRILRKE
ncbi:hypothetical protein [Fusobacterium russii]|uniref:hypothetical protein n=1 Tax=Fusobacterium russii TaxID=854 RepID=UPI001FDF0817|nr:hypothetical protein [Fusobacterium russii]